MDLSPEEERRKFNLVQDSNTKANEAHEAVAINKVKIEYIEKAVDKLTVDVKEVKKDITELRQENSDQHKDAQLAQMERHNNLLKKINDMHPLNMIKNVYKTSPKIAWGVTVFLGIYFVGGPEMISSFVEFIKEFKF